MDNSSNNVLTIFNLIVKTKVHKTLSSVAIAAANQNSFYASKGPRAMERDSQTLNGQKSIFERALTWLERLLPKKPSMKLFNS